MKSAQEICDEEFAKRWEKQFTQTTYKIYKQYHGTCGHEEWFKSAFMLQEERIKILEEALEFYADKKSWKEDSECMDEVVIEETDWEINIKTAA